MNFLRKVVGALAPKDIIVDVLSFPFVDGDGVVGCWDEGHH